ncbi:yecA family protein [Pannonibacter phragmitetus]|uniref:YecA family protein n=1 Tax=Pannonibacter phragmitetus TaxID=121719 RepID=A0A378ZYY3_9HYPH|nr:UPF0149 family protein [Pannonibacter phragmitetus]SUB02412.1 yecA family protein [Pannonibacter phragmitetus]
MTSEQFEIALAELLRLKDHHDIRREVTGHISQSLLRSPALGGQLVMKICALDEGNTKLEVLAELLGNALDTARMAYESHQKRGGALLAAITEAVDLAAGQQRLTAFHRLRLAPLWIRAGLPAPASLEIRASGMEQEAVSLPIQDAAEEHALLDQLFSNLLEQTEGDALEVYGLLVEMLAAMPAQMREHLIAWSVRQPGPVHAKLSCFWLLDQSASVRAIAAHGLAENAAAGMLPSDTAGKLAFLRNWMPQDGASAAVDRALKEAMRSGYSAGTPTVPWTIQSVMATLPDGAGAWSFLVALQSGHRRKAAMLLLKQGHGIKDAYALSFGSVRQQNSLIQNFSVETSPVKISRSWMERSLAMALADGLAAGLPPAPGLMEVAELCGLGALRPETVSTEALIEDLPSAQRIRGLPAQERGKLVNASAEWWTRHEIILSWFEDSDQSHDLLRSHKSRKARDNALWRLLETRRDVWARHLALSAGTLADAGHPDADSFTAAALALLEGQDLKKIPAMSFIHGQTMQALLQDAHYMDMSPMPEELHEAEEDEEAPERKGELAGILKGSTVTADWIDGFLMAAVIAPKEISPDKWLPEILNNARASITMDNIQRFAGLLMMRANNCLDQAHEGALFTAAMSRRSRKAMQAWATGFSHARTHFKSSWPAKAMTSSDRQMLQTVADAIPRGFHPEEIKTLSECIAARHTRNME